jgi:hypothetical protein
MRPLLKVVHLFLSLSCPGGPPLDSPGGPPPDSPGGPLPDRAGVVPDRPGDEPPATTAGTFPVNPGGPPPATTGSAVADAAGEPCGPPGIPAPDIPGGPITVLSIGLGGNVLTAEITLVDGSEIAVVRVVVTGVVASDVGACTKVGAATAPGRVAEGFSDAAAVVEVKVTVAVPAVIL